MPDFFIAYYRCMKIIASHFEDEVALEKDQKTVEYTCDSKKQKINMEVVEIPAETRRLLLIVDDPKIPGSKYTCCVGWNLLEPEASPFTRNTDTEIKKEDFLEKDNPHDDNPNVDFFEILCKPGTNLYHFKVYALDNEPRITTGMVKEDVEKALEGHILDSAEIVAAHRQE